jgi:hypothetical protein
MPVVISCVLDFANTFRHALMGFAELSGTEKTILKKTNTLEVVMLWTFSQVVANEAGRSTWYVDM